MVRRWKWKVLLIPSKLTGLLQPLDAWVFAQFKKKIHMSTMNSNIQRNEVQHDLDLWLGNVLGAISSTFTESSGQLFFEKCGLTARKERIRQSVLKHVKPELLGTIRKLTPDELTFYIGRNAVALHNHLFATPVPDAYHNLHVHRFVPQQRISTKQALHCE